MSFAVELEAVSHRYGQTAVLLEVSLQVPPGAFVSLLGPSGCGKTTLLKLIGGYLQPVSGTIRIRGHDVTALSPEQRKVGFVFQNYALFPHKTARGNVAFPLEIRGVSRRETQSRVDAIFDRLQLSGPERDHYPHELSGGQQQRVALARALVFDPDLLVLDEPLANLDRHLREELLDEMRRVQRETGVTTILVTHDQDEALAVSDSLGVLLDGELKQFGSPRDLYDRPNSLAVARALGEINLLPGELLGRSPGKTVLIRPEKLHSPGPLVGQVIALRQRGPDALVEIRGPNFHLRWRTSAFPFPAIGDTVALGVDAGDIWEMPES